MTELKPKIDRNLNKPEIAETVDGYLFSWDDVNIKVSRLNVHTDGRVTGEIIIRAGKKILQPATQINFSADMTRRSLVKGLSEKYHDKDWQPIIDYLAHHVQEMARKGEPVKELWTSDDIYSPEFLLSPILYKGLPSIIFGEKAVCKSTLSLAIYACLMLPWYDNPLGWAAPNRSVKTILLDYEVDHNVAQWNAKKLQQGMDLPAFPLYYRRCSIPLADDVEQLHKHIADVKAEAIIVDSLGPAVGGDLKDPKQALRFTAALRQLGCSTLIIGQTSKDKEGKVKSVYGSTFFEYYARNIWELRKVQEENDDTLDIAMYNTYHNLGRRFKAMGYRLNFNGTGTHINQTDITARELVTRIGVQAQIIQYLKECTNATPKQIAEETNTDAGTIRGTLKRMVEKESIVKLMDGSYGLSSRF